jgi:hypothetical protein
MKLLNLDPVDRLNCQIIYNVNRFEIFHAEGWMMSAANTKSMLIEIITGNRLDAHFDSLAAINYLAM